MQFKGGVWETPHSSSSVVPLPRYGASAVLHGDKIFLYGGVVTEHLRGNNVQRHHSKYRYMHSFFWFLKILILLFFFVDILNTLGPLTLEIRLVI